MNVEFKPWPKIGRENPFGVTITEKIDGTNACVIIENGELVGVQSRKRLITPEDDNYGFAAWAHAHASELTELGDGYHFGEWAGEGIQKNPLKMTGKHFFLFNASRWHGECPACCLCVPLLFRGLLEHDTIPSILADLESDENRTHEGVCVYYHAFGMYTKHTIKSPNGKWHK